MTIGGKIGRPYGTLFLEFAFIDGLKSVVTKHFVATDAVRGAKNCKKNQSPIGTKHFVATDEVRGKKNENNNRVPSGRNIL